MRANIPRKELRHLPFTTLSAIALSLARDIDAGDEGKRFILEVVFDAIKNPHPPSIGC